MNEHVYMIILTSVISLLSSFIDSLWKIYRGAKRENAGNKASMLIFAFLFLAGED